MRWAPDDAASHRVAAVGGLSLTDAVDPDEPGHKCADGSGQGNEIAHDRYEEGQRSQYTEDQGDVTGSVARRRSRCVARHGDHATGAMLSEGSGRRLGAVKVAVETA